MRLRKVLSLSVLICLPALAKAWTLGSSDSQQHGWASSNIQILVNTSNCPNSVDLLNLVLDAMAVWNNVSTSSIKFTYAGTTSSTSSGIPAVVYCESNFQSVAGLDQNYVSGATAFNTLDNHIVQGVIRMNVSSGNASLANIGTTAASIVMTHEMGHLLGLGHSSSQTALMYYSSSGKTTVSLSQDDVDGVSYLYPANEIGGAGSMCAMIQNRKPPSPRNLLLLLLLVSLPIFSVFGMRRKYAAK